LLSQTSSFDARLCCCVTLIAPVATVATSNGRNYSRDYSLRIGQQLAAVVTATGMESSSTRGSQCASDDLPLRSVGPVDDLQVCQRAMQNVNAARLFTSP
jgi:hypothetical protein